MRKITTASMAAAGCLFLGACGTQQPAQTAAADRRVATQTSPAPELLRFKATTLDGAAFDGATLAGKPVVFWAWAPSCAVCQAEAPHMAKLAQRYGYRVTFVGLAGMADKQAMRTFVKDRGVNGFTQVADVDGSVWTKLGITQQASFLFLRPDGTTDKAMGQLGEQKLAERLDALVS